MTFPFVAHACLGSLLSSSHLHTGTNPLARSLPDMNIDIDSKNNNKKWIEKAIKFYLKLRFHVSQTLANTNIG